MEISKSEPAIANRLYDGSASSLLNEVMRVKTADRKAIYRVLRVHGIEKAYCNVEVDPTDFAIFLDDSDFEKADVAHLTTELMHAVPHAKIWVTRLSGAFETVGL